MQCREKCRLKVRERLSRIGTSPALYYGSLVHEVLDMYYSHRAEVVHSPKGMVDAAVEKLNDSLNGVQQETESHAAMALAVLPAYFRYWKRSDSKFSWLDVEHEFDLPLRLPSGRESRLRGKIDGVFMLNKGLWILETKTASKVEETALMDRLPFDLQTGLYLHAAHLITGIRPKGVIYNILRKPQLRQKKAEHFKAFWERTTADVAKRPGFYFLRYEIRRTRDEASRWLREFEAVLADLEQWHGGDQFHYRNSNECQGRYGNCEFLPVCSRGDTSNFTQRKVQFPELASSE
jgi:hypothetical protein